MTGRHRRHPDTLDTLIEWTRAGMARLGLDLPDDPPRCWSCGHPWDAGCECTCCGDNAPEGWGPDNV